MDFQTILSWLFSEAGAGWAAALFVVIVAVVGWIIAWRRRERPPRVIIQEIERIKLLDIHPSQRDRLRVSYINDKGVPLPVEDLRQKEIVIYNDGTKDILEPLDFRLRFIDPDSADKPFLGFWRWFFDDSRHVSTQLQEQETVEMGTATIHKTVWIGVHIELPYLNSYRIHGDYVTAHLISDAEFEITPWGKESGKGWSAHFVALERAEKTRARLQWVSAMGALPSAVLPGLVAFTIVDRFFLIENTYVQASIELVGAVAFGMLGLFTWAFGVDLIMQSFGGLMLGARMPSEFKQTGS